MTPRFLGPRTYALLALGVVAFTLYGSYVPFHYRDRPWSEAVDAFEWAMENRLAMESRSDWASNLLLGVPLGFCCLAALRVDRPSRPQATLAGLAILPVCVAFAAAVEFGQLYFPGRTCAGSDVWAQGMGAAVGVLLWVLRGQWITDKLRGAFVQPGQQGNPAALLLAYASFALLVQLLPLNLTASPAVLYHRAKDSAQVTLIPLGELNPEPGQPSVDELEKLQAWLELLALSWPLGALIARLPGTWRLIDGFPRVFAVALLGSTLAELGQLTVSRHPSTTDVLLLAFGICAGWAAALSFADRGVRDVRLRVALVSGTLWFAALALIHWHPFDFRPAILADRLGDLEWMPMADQAAKNYLWALNEVLTKFTLFVPIGVLAVWARRTTVSRPSVLIPVLLSGGVAAILEFGQAMIPSRTPSPTDLLFGIVGGWIGAEVTRRVSSGARRESALPQSPRVAIKPRAAVLPARISN